MLSGKHLEWSGAIIAGEGVEWWAIHWLVLEGGIGQNGTEGAETGKDDGQMDCPWKEAKMCF